MLATMKTVPSNMVTVTKAPGPGGKPTIVITKPGIAANAGVPMPGRQTPQIIVVTTGSALCSVQTATTSLSGGG